MLVGELDAVVDTRDAFTVQHSTRARIHGVCL